MLSLVSNHVNGSGSRAQKEDAAWRAVRKCWMNRVTSCMLKLMGGLILMMLLYRPSVLTIMWFLYMLVFTLTAVCSSGSRDSRSFTNSIPKNSPIPLGWYALCCTLSSPFFFSLSQTTSFYSLYYSVLRCCNTK